MAGIARPRASISVSISRANADWIAEESERRMVSRALLVDRAITLLREAVDRAPDLVPLPPPPREPSTPAESLQEPSTGTLDTDTPHDPESES